jgi:ABC-type multidrug transport system fused ATPase/permease subunit
VIGMPPGPGISERRSPLRFLWWLIVSQRRRVAAGALLGNLWMIGLTLPPYLLSRAIDEGLQPGRYRSLLGWTAALLGVGVLNAWLAIMRHRTMTRVRIDAAYRTVRAVVVHTTRLGATLRRKVSAGEVVTIGIADIAAIANTLTITGPGGGAVIAYIVVAFLLLSVSPLLAMVALLGVPVLAVMVGPLLGRLQGVQMTYREQQGALTSRLGDIVKGLRVLNGLGGKEVYEERYRRDSDRLRAEGYRVGGITSWIEALGVGLPLLFLAAVTWLTARMAAQGTVTIGELVAVYGFVAVLVVPVSFFVEGASDLGRGLVAARRVVRFLDLEPDFLGGATIMDAPSSPSPLRDPESGVEIATGRLTALVSAQLAETMAVADRLGRFTETAVRWGEIRLDQVPLEQVRARILVADNDADLFAGTLRDVVSGRFDPDEEAINHALHAALAHDVVLGLPNGLDAPVEAQGHNLSGGQRQRIRLVRALLADSEVLIAIDPTSAVDAHTEAAVAARLRAARFDRTTVVTTTSPLMLDHADTVYYIVDGKMSAVGTHRDLLREQPGYRSIVSRGANDQAANDQAANDQAANDQAANDQAANDQAANDQGTNDQGTNDQGTNDQGTNDQGTNDQGTDRHDTRPLRLARPSQEIVR